MSGKRNIASLLFLFFVQISFAQPRTIIDFDKNWKFFLGDDTNSISSHFNDSRWGVLNLPHDWSIEGRFSETNPATTQGGALPGGIGWYRKTFTLPVSAKSKKVSIEFDGIYRNSEVWINEHYLGNRPNGYISFQYDLTPYIKAFPEKNIIAVRVDNSEQPNSRWYSGSGIYRNVRMVITNQVAIQQWGVFITTSLTNKKEATINIEAKISNTSGEYKAFNYSIAIYKSSGKIVAEAKDRSTINILTPAIIKAAVKIQNPLLWSVDNPNLYKAVVTIVQNGKQIDEYTTFFGIRSFYFDRQRGFFLNNQALKIKGVCMHHDLGALGAAFNYRAAERQLQILKTMGCNAIRTAHNPSAPEFLDLCDRMGFLVMDEAFDMWKKKKTKYDYSSDFEQWHKKDLEDMVLRDRNHPCVFMWSIGNEIREQFDSSGIAIAKELVSIIRKSDTTRPVTSALTETDTTKNFIYQSHALDVLGWNYKQQNYPDVLKKYPNQIFIASETNSAIASRGHYDFPSDSIRIWPPKGKKEIENINGDWTVSAYDNAMAGWGSTHEETWKIIKKYDYLSGLFIWTGFDYLGEPTPYPWHARSSYFGIIDLAGFPKDVYYMYQSEWTNKPMLHLFPHWNWKEGQIVDVWAYYNNADEVELFLNNKSLGVRKKPGDDLHVMWRVPFVPGELKAISRKNGKTVLTKEIKTAGTPAKIELLADRKIIKADGRDLFFITVKVLDKNGNLVPGADNLIHFAIYGEGIIAGTDNGYQADIESFQSKNRKCWKGLALVIVRSTEKKGNITLTATADGLPSTILSLQTTN